MHFGSRKWCNQIWYPSILTRSSVFETHTLQLNYPPLDRFRNKSCWVYVDTELDWYLPAHSIYSNVIRTFHSSAQHRWWTSRKFIRYIHKDSSKMLHQLHFHLINVWRDYQAHSNANTNTIEYSLTTIGEPVPQHSHGQKWVLLLDKKEWVRAQDIMHHQEGVNFSLNDGWILENPVCCSLLT